MIDGERLARLAANLRAQLPKTTDAEVSKAMVDAAGEMQRMADEIDLFGRENAAEPQERMKQAMADGCQCAQCTAVRRAAAGREQAKLSSLPRAKPKVVACSSCGAAIVFLRAASGKYVPCENQNIADDDVKFDHTRHTAHFASCPNAAKHRKPRK